MDLVVSPVHQHSSATDSGICGSEGDDRKPDTSILIRIE